MKIKTYLPVFPGFYSTAFEPDETNEIECINDERQAKSLTALNFDQIQFDYKDYFERVSKACCNAVENQLNDEIGIKCTIKFEELVQPREYNFCNDSINCEIDLKVNDVALYLNNHKVRFQDYVLEHFSSRSGFSSFYSNDANVWLNEYLSEIDIKPVVLGAMLDFILTNEGYEHYQLYEDVSDSGDMYISSSNYNELINS